MPDERAPSAPLLGHHARLSNTSTLTTPERDTERASTNAHVYERILNADLATDRSESTDTAQVPPTTLQDDGEKPSPNLEAATLAKGRFHWCFLMPLDVVLALSPLFFLVIASLCLLLNGRPKSKYGEDIRAITLLSPTIFPIVYAAIFGKMLRRVGLFKAERSATIETVERLIGCQSLFTTFERQFAFRRVDLLGLSILVAWLLSPLGGQASLRLLSTKLSLVHFNDTVKYYPIEGFSRQTHLFNPSVALTAWPLFSPLYMTALLTSNKYLSLPMDLFDNVKIPDILQLPSYSGEVNDTAWYGIDHQNPVEYSSTLGIPVAGLPDSGNTSFNLVSHYWAVKCAPFEFVSSFNKTNMSRIPTFDMPYDITSGTDNDTQFRYQSRYITQETKNASGILLGGRLSRAECSTHPLVVESRVDCQGRSCAVQEMRRLYRKPDDIIGNYESASAWFGIICANMPGIDLGMSQDEHTSSELVEHWMMSPDLNTFRWDESLSLQRSPVSRRWVDVANLPPETFTRRFQTAINTFWDASIGSTIRMGNLTKDQVDSFEAVGYKFTWNTTTLQGVRQEGEQYVCHTWFAIGTIAISLLLFVAAITSLILGLLTKAPDTLGFVSTSARDNPYVTRQVPSHLDGLEAARELRKVRIRIGDVNSTGDVGHVAFASMEVEPKRVSRKRLYD